MITIERVQKLEAVRRFKKELRHLEYYLLESPWRYKGEGTSIKPTLEALRKWYNRTIEQLLKLKS